MDERTRLEIGYFIEDMLRKRGVVIACVCIGLIIFAGLSCMKLGSLALEKDEAAEYSEKIAEYDEVIADLRDNIALADAQIEELSDYIDNAIYMKLDPQNLETASVRYAVTGEANTSNVFNSLTSYINDGGLREELEEDPEGKELETEYWKDIISVSTGGNVISITVIHYDARKAAAILDVIRERVEAELPAIRQAQGDFQLRELGTAYYIKADLNVTNTQNNNRNSLRNYLSSRVDYTNKLISNQTNRTKYIEEYAPLGESGSVSPAAIIIMYLIIGALLGFIFSAFIIYAGYAAVKKVRSADDLELMDIHVIGGVHARDNEADALTRGLAELEILSGRNRDESPESDKSHGVFFDIPGGDELSEGIASLYIDALKESGIEAVWGAHIDENPEEFATLCSMGEAVIIVRLYRDSLFRVQKEAKKLSYLGIDILGSIVVE